MSSSQPFSLLTNRMPTHPKRHAPARPAPQPPAPQSPAPDPAPPAAAAAAETAAADAAKPSPPSPPARAGERLNITHLKDMSIQKLTQVAKDLNVAGATGMRK